MHPSTSFINANIGGQFVGGGGSGSESELKMLTSLVNTAEKCNLQRYVSLNACKIT